jgi:hypothetical protein
VTDALRSIIISQQLLGTREIIIVHHVCKKKYCLPNKFQSILIISDRLWNADLYRRGDPREGPSRSAPERRPYCILAI